jgi:hypothetical protein
MNESNVATAPGSYGYVHVVAREKERRLKKTKNKDDFDNSFPKIQSTTVQFRTLHFTFIHSHQTWFVSTSTLIIIYIIY